MASEQPQAEKPRILHRGAWTQAAPCKEEKFFRNVSDSIGNNYSPAARALSTSYIYKLLGSSGSRQQQLKDESTTTSTSHSQSGPKLLKNKHSRLLQSRSKLSPHRLLHQRHCDELFTNMATQGTEFCLTTTNSLTRMATFDHEFAAPTLRLQPLERGAHSAPAQRAGCFDSKTWARAPWMPEEQVHGGDGDGSVLGHDSLKMRRTQPGTREDNLFSDSDWRQPADHRWVWDSVACNWENRSNGELSVFLSTSGGLK
ncbi:uncharacterized protein LOC134359585 [Mobula hypostoma]|uniref:uncharacterized protein LOC134359585 n=1 Tax=Mobula hypostoma TaxID=723540 RepID=UPI002FC38673